MVKEKTPQDIAKEQEQQLADERSGKAPFFYPDHDVTIWAENREQADSELEKQLKKDDRKENE